MPTSTKIALAMVRACTKCGCYEPLRGMTEECCLRVRNQACVFADESRRGVTHPPERTRGRSRSRRSSRGRNQLLAAAAHHAAAAAAAAALAAQDAATRAAEAASQAADEAAKAASQAFSASDAAAAARFLTLTPAAVAAGCGGEDGDDHSQKQD